MKAVVQSQEKSLRLNSRSFSHLDADMKKWLAEV